ncbi:cilia- and flagella-associated protein 65 isoform X2 [Erpetoichthys calabaricus]|nr:cilia- and flagella-associated protein 65 isoform X2 [Erpetoichthys calabaricus]
MQAEISRPLVSIDPFLKPEFKRSKQLRLLQILEMPERCGRLPKRMNCTCGIEVAKELVWENWELGREITKLLKLKNVQSKKQILTFSSPSSKFFTTLFPQSISLNPGMSFCLPVTFHPTEKCEYNDSIWFELGDSSFQVLLRATLPGYALEMPDAVHLPTCGACDSSEAIFQMKNISMYPTSFSWVVPEPFQFNPAKGTLNAGSRCTIKVIFRPYGALVYEDIATCKSTGEEESTKSICLRGISKYPHILVKVPENMQQITQHDDTQTVLDFGCIAVGSTVEKHIEVFNLSQVKAVFRISRAHRPALMDPVFFCNKHQAVIQADGKIKIPVLFSPQTVGITNVDYFYVGTTGNTSKSILKVVGSSKGPLVSLEKSLVDFGCVNLGKSATCTLELKNFSDVTTYYQFNTDCSHSVFVIDQPQGILDGLTSKTLSVTFHPMQPINYYRRLACLIQYQDPLYVNMIGTCHSEQIKPGILKPQHIDLYQINMARGLTYYPPDDLSTMLSEKKLTLDQMGALLQKQQKADRYQAENIDNEGIRKDKASDTMEQPPLIHPLAEYFNDTFSSTDSSLPPHVSIDVQEFVFSSATQSCPFSMTNHTMGKVSIAWVCTANSVFTISPQACDIPPLKSTAFRVTFTPDKTNALYGAELECFASYKVMKDHRLFEDCTLCPPWCLTIRVTGHSFQPGLTHFIPKYTLQSPRMVFLPVFQGETTYQSLLFQNIGDLPITYKLDTELCPDITVKPSVGIIPAGARQFFMLKTVPQAGRIHKHILPILLNASEKYIQEVTLLSAAEKPKIALEGDGMLFFKPTCLYGLSQRSYIIKNMNRMPMNFEWKIYSDDSQVLSVAPTSGIIQPNECLAQVWSFLPLEEMRYTITANLLFWRASEKPNAQAIKKTRLTLKIFGEGCKGVITAEQPVIDLCDVLVGDCQSCDLVLLNKDSCSLDFVLEVDQEISGPCDPEEVNDDPTVLDLEVSKGTIPARSKIIIRATGRPSRRLNYSWSIRYHILAPRAPAHVLEKSMPLCQIKARGVYPMITVTDARSSGSSKGISKRHLWKLFSLDTLNSYLQRDPTPSELIYRVPTRHSIRRCPSVFTPTVLNFNFGAAPLGSEPSSVLLMFENKETIPVKWTFLFPADQQIELEYWAETGEFDPAELNAMSIQENKLFTVSPKSGFLFPGQQKSMQLSYRHDFLGISRLPVLLKLSHGREILLNFIGVTIEKDRHYVYFTSNKHTFAPVAIGSFSPPKQIYELFNGGAAPVNYYIDLEPLRVMEEENFNHPIFKCLNPSGQIPPGRAVHIEWIFSPLEAKMYEVDVPVHIIGGESALISFCGVGYNRKLLGESAPDRTTSALFSVPPVQKVPLPDQVVFLSEEQVSIGDIPVYSKTTRIFFLYNTSEKEKMHFTWHNTSEMSKAVSIMPSSGELAPGESCLCILTLFASGSPSFYLLEFICQVTSKHALAQYKRELLEWEKEKDRQFTEFSITDKNIKTSSPSKDALDDLHKVGGNIRKYKTLPPISRTSYVRRSHKSLRRRQRAAGMLWKKPEAPDPFPLHLAVLARSHSLEEFEANFPSELQKHYIYRSTSAKQESNSMESTSSEGQYSSIANNSTDREIISDVLMLMIRSLLDDPPFQQSLAETLSEPVPYFCQMQSEDSYRTLTNQEDTNADYDESMSTHSDRSVQSVTFNKDPKLPITDRQSVEMQRQEFIHQEQQLELKENIKRLPEFCNLLEEIFLNTLQNIMREANSGELVLTSRPRVIALPPGTPKGSLSNSSPRSSHRSIDNNSPGLQEKSSGNRTNLHKGQHIYNTKEKER